jgi:hypothetical protein
MRGCKLLVAAAVLTASVLGARDRLTVAVVDEVGLSNAILTPAVKLARLTFADAGVRPVWTISRQLPMGPGPFLIVKLAPKATARPEGTTAEGTLAGFAVTGAEAANGAQVFVFLDTVESFAAASNQRVHVVLGCILIHEIAHTLGLKHESHGLMAPVLRPPEMKNVSLGLGFSSADARQLRLGLARLF